MNSDVAIYLVIAVSIAALVYYFGVHLPRQTEKGKARRATAKQKALILKRIWQARDRKVLDKAKTVAAVLGNTQADCVKSVNDQVNAEYLTGDLRICASGTGAEIHVGPETSLVFKGSRMTEVVGNSEAGYEIKDVYGQAEITAYVPGDWEVRLDNLYREAVEKAEERAALQKQQDASDKRKRFGI